MSQLTIRSDEELVERVRRAAQAHGLSINVYVVRVLDAATNPDWVSDAAERLRERLAAAELLATERPAQRRERPSREAVAAARQRAGGGTLLSDIVAETR